MSANTSRYNQNHHRSIISQLSQLPQTAEVVQNPSSSLTSASKEAETKHAGYSGLSDNSDHEHSLLLLTEDSSDIEFVRKDSTSIKDSRDSKFHIVLNFSQIRLAIGDLVEAEDPQLSFANVLFEEAKSSPNHSELDDVTKQLNELTLNNSDTPLRTQSTGKQSVIDTALVFGMSNDLAENIQPSSTARENNSSHQYKMDQETVTTQIDSLEDDINDFLGENPSEDINKNQWTQWIEISAILLMQGIF